MLKANTSYIVLLLIFIFAFAYRLLPLIWATFPPGADIGLHTSVINSITQGGNTNFLYDFYQMGGGLSLTFPGYHIFTAGVIMVTGMPSYVAQAVVVSLFSSLLVLCAFLITRAVWTESAAFIVAFLVAVSRPDMEIILWGGYPNIITLLLIPLTFYLFLQKERFTLTPFLVSTSLLVGSIYLTHSLSSAVFVATTVVTVLVVMVAPKTFGTSRKHVFYWLLPLALGAALVSPFLIDAIPAYLGSNSSFNAISAINSAILSTRLIAADVASPLFGCSFLFFLLSKVYKGRFLSLPTILLFMWLLIPTVLTGGYLFGLYVDYNRFLYFVTLPVMILIGMFIDHGSAFFAQSIDKLRVLLSQAQKTTVKAVHPTLTKISRRITRKALFGGFVLGIILICFFAFPIFATPWQINTDQNFYQVMDNSGYQAIQWAKQNTPPGSVFVSDALYGWWLGGFAERPTLSAVEPQYLTVARELNPALNASQLLDTDYMIDNGYLQVREDGGYLARHNPEFLADVNWTYFPISYFQFNDSEILLTLGGGSILPVAPLPVTNQGLVTDKTGTSSTITVNKANGQLSYSEILTVTQGLQFANMTIVLQSNAENVTFDSIQFSLNSQGVFQAPIGNTVAMLDSGMKECGQLIFAQDQPSILPLNTASPCITQLLYSLNGQSSVEIQILVGLYPVSDSDMANMSKTLLTHEQEALTLQPKASPLTTFDYQTMLQQYNVSYVANRDFEVNPKFADDPQYSLVFINNEVAIFKVKANINPAGS